MLATPARTSERSPLEVVVVLDVSSSMRIHDPKRLSQFAVEILAQFLDDDDRLGVVPLGSGDSVPLTSVTTLRKDLSERMSGLSYRGGTPCLDAMRHANKVLDESPTPPTGQVVVFLTDGVCHEGQPDKVSRDTALIEEVDEMASDGRRVFGIALGPEADASFVATLSRLTDVDWPAEPVRDARQLPAIFARLSAAFRATEAKDLDLPVGAAVLPIDPYMRRVTVLAIADSSPIALADPRSPSDDVSASPVNGRFPRTGPTYSGWSLLRLDRPEAGDWRVRIEGSRAPAAVAVFDYALRARLEVVAGPEGMAVGAPLTVRATLETPEGEPVLASFLEGVTARLELRAPGSNTWRDLGQLEYDRVAWLEQRTTFGALGKHLLRVRMVRGKSLDLRAFHTLNVGPVVALDELAVENDIRCLDTETGTELTVRLHDALGQRLAPPPPSLEPHETTVFEVSLWAGLTPDALSRVALFEQVTSGVYSARWRPRAAGEYRFEIRVTSADGLDVRSPPARAFAPDVELHTSPIAPLGELRPGDRRALSFSLTGRWIAPPLTATLERSALSLPQGVEIVSAPFHLDTEPAEMPIEVRVSPDGDVPDGQLTGTWQVRLEGPCVSALVDGGPASGRVRALSFWERHGTTLIWAVGTLVFLLWLVHALRCAARTHRFAEGLRVLHGVEPNDLHPIDVADSRSRRSILVPGRCRSERLYWNEADATFFRTRNPTWYIEAAGSNAARLVAPAGTRITAAPRARPTNSRDLEPSSAKAAADISVPLSPAEIYRIGPIFIRIE